MALVSSFGVNSDVIQHLNETQKFFRNSRTLKKGLVVNNIMLLFVASQFVQLYFVLIRKQPS